MLKLTCFDDVYIRCIRESSMNGFANIIVISFPPADSPLVCLDKYVILFDNMHFTINLVLQTARYVQGRLLE